MIKNHQSRLKGMDAEERACQFLIRHGFEIVDRNFHSRFGEIDIIALKDSVLHFIEVKSGVSFEPIYAITPKKVEKIYKTLQFYIFQNKLDYPYCISAVIVRGEEIEIYENLGF